MDAFFVCFYLDGGFPTAVGADGLVAGAFVSQFEVVLVVAIPFSQALIGSVSAQLIATR